MKKILFIAYQFPPKSGPGVHRSINLVKYLPDFGYQPIVLTVDSEEWRKLGQQTDDSLLNLIPENTKIIRTPSYEPQKFIQFAMKWKFYRICWFLFYPFLWEWSLPWAIKNYKKAKQLIKEHDIQLVYTTSGPFSSLLLGWKLKRKLKIRWVADLRDPFTDAYAWQFPSKIHWYAMRIFEKILFAQPDVLVVNTDEVKKRYTQRNYRSENTIQVINNGY
jgi:glycosyltransferase involved in cell wall biosynthesis